MPDTPNPKISIIMPAYNAQDFVLGCLQSIAAQSFADFECLCIDDGSSDNTAAIIAEFAQNDPRFKLIQQANTKLPGARNKGLELAVAEVIAFVDSDDYVHPYFLEVLYTAMQQENADVAGCQYQKTTELYRPTLLQKPTYQTHVFQNPLQAFLRRRDTPTNVWVRLYKRSAIENMRFKEGVYFEDVLWTIDIMSRIKCYVNVSAKLYYYYHNPASITRSAWTVEKTQSYIDVINASYDLIQERAPQDLADTRKYIMNGRIKMILTRIKKSPASAQAALTAHARPLIVTLYEQGRISYAGLKLKHKFRLWRFLKSAPQL